MNNSTERHYRTMGEIAHESGWTGLMKAYQEHGLHSVEFQEARLVLQKNLARSEAEYQIRKAANQARLYEEGY